MSMPAQGTVAEAVNRICETVCWLEDGAIATLDNNVHLAKALTDRGVPTSHSYLSRLRQGKLALAPRIDLIFELCDLMNEKSQSAVSITPDYFFVASTRAQVDRALDSEKARVEQLVTSNHKRAKRQRQRGGHNQAREN